MTAASVSPARFPIPSSTSGAENFLFLAEVHADQDPYGVAEYYQGDESAAVAALELRLAEHDMKEILAQLEAMR